MPPADGTTDRALNLWWALVTRVIARGDGDLGGDRHELASRVTASTDLSHRCGAFDPVKKRNVECVSLIVTRQILYLQEADFIVIQIMEGEANTAFTFSTITKH